MKYVPYFRYFRPITYGFIIAMSAMVAFDMAIVTTGGNLEAAAVAGVIGGICGAIFPYAAPFAGELIGGVVGLSAETVGNIVAGAAVGALGGGMNAAYYGTNIGEGMLYGALAGAAGAAAYEIIAAAIDWVRSLKPVASSGGLGRGREIDLSQLKQYADNGRYTTFTDVGSGTQELNISALRKIDYFSCMDVYESNGFYQFASKHSLINSVPDFFMHSGKEIGLLVGERTVHTASAIVQMGDYTSTTLRAVGIGSKLIGGACHGYTAITYFSTVLQGAAYGNCATQAYIIPMIW